MEIKLPMPAQYILNRLHGCGYEAYVVGGCVRDSIMNVPPHDWDICTSALPEQVIEVFKDYRTILAGVDHGTVSVLFGDTPISRNIYEITTYRVDGEYKDNRRPEKVEFVSDLALDLARRDFTINAMAYNEEDGLIDIYGGKSDIENKIIRCVGNPDERFSEDALRIMRAIRFALRYNYEIEPETFASMNAHKELLKNISAERICSELSQIYRGATVLSAIYKSNSPQQKDNLKKLHEAALDYIETILTPNLYTRPKMVFEKLYALRSPQSEVNFAIVFDSPNIAKVMKCLRFSNSTIKEVLDIYTYGRKIANDYPRWVINADEKCLNVNVSTYYARKILHEVKNALPFLVMDYAKSLSYSMDMTATERERYKKMVSALYSEVLSCQINNDIYDIKFLAVNGNDIKQLGYDGEQVGMILNNLLDLVMKDKVLNVRQCLIEAVAKHKLGEHHV